MTDDKLVTPDSTALNDFITAVDAFFFVHKHLSFFGILAVRLFACGTELLHTGVSSKFWKLCLKLASCPAHALKARQTQIFILRHYLRKGHCTRTFQTGITHLEVEGHIIVSGFLVFLQDGFYLALNGLEISHRIPPYMERGGSSIQAAPISYLFFLLRIFSQIAPPTINATSTMATIVFASIP